MDKSHTSTQNRTTRLPAQRQGERLQNFSSNKYKASEFFGHLPSARHNEQCQRICTPAAERGQTKKHAGSKKIKNERKVQEKNKSNNTKLTTEAKTPCEKKQEKSLTQARRRAFSRQSEPLAVCFRTAVHNSLNQIQQFDNRWKATAMIYFPPQESSHLEVHRRYCSTRKPLAMAMA